MISPVKFLDFIILQNRYRSIDQVPLFWDLNCNNRKRHGDATVTGNRIGIPFIRIDRKPTF